MYKYTCCVCGNKFETENIEDDEFCSMECFHKDEEREIERLDHEFELKEEELKDLNYRIFREMYVLK